MCEQSGQCFYEAISEASLAAKPPSPQSLLFHMQFPTCPTLSDVGDMWSSTFSLDLASITFSVVSSQRSPPPLAFPWVPDIVGHPISSLTHTLPKQQDIP